MHGTTIRGTRCGFLRSRVTGWERTVDGLYVETDGGFYELRATSAEVEGLISQIESEGGEE